ncbi:hypothetical protein GGH96_002716 [Coemansia sp. RSA 1972]|nr:hypothetical protein GGH96_002716 [Coemansia sp. RSA 1972]
MENYSADSRDKLASVSDNSPGSDKGATTPFELLDAPNRYASDIQGELVRLGQVTRSKPLQSLRMPSDSPTSTSAQPAPAYNTHSEAEPRNNSMFSDYSRGPSPRAMYQPPVFARNMIVTSAHPMAQYQVQPWGHILPVYHHQTGNAGPFRGATYPAPGQHMYGPPQSHCLPPIPPGAGNPSFGHSPSQLHYPYSLPTPVDDTHYVRHSDQPVEGVSRQVSHTRNTSLSEGELDETSEHGYLSDGEVRSNRSEVYSPPPQPSVEPTVDQTVNMDVVAIVKERVAAMLKLREPKLLQSPKFRALMLLLKCIKFDNLVDICACMKDTPLQIVSELHLLAHEFGLLMIIDSCASVELAVSVIPMAIADGVSANGVSALSVSSVEGMATRETSAERDSSPEVDMDTSSDAGYEEESPQPLEQRAASFALPRPQSVSIIQVASARDMTPSPPPGFSRSRAPSPPSAHPRASRVTTLSTQMQMLSDKDEEDENIEDGQLEDVDSPEQIDSTFPVIDSAVRVDSRSSEQSLVSTPNMTNRNFENSVCVHESDRMVVYLDESSTGSESGFDSDIEDSSGSLMTQRAARRRLQSADKLRSESGADYSSRPMSRVQSNTSLVSMDTGDSLSSNARKSSEVLLKAKSDLKAHETEIARLRLQIQQRQTKALLLKKLQNSKQQRLENQKISVSLPSTPNPAPVQDNKDTGPIELPSLDKAPVVPTKTNTKVENAIAESRVALAVHHTETDVPQQPESQLKPLSVNYNKLKSELSRVSDEVRRQHLETAVTHLDDTIELKRMVLCLLARSSPPSGGKPADAESKSFAQASKRLAARHQRLGLERDELQQRMRSMHAMLMLAGAEKRLLDYSYEAGSELQATISSGSSVRAAQDLESEIQTIVQMREAVGKLAEAPEVTSDKPADIKVKSQTVTTVEEPARPAPEKSVVSPAVQPQAKSAVATLRAKLVSMQEEQSSISKRLVVLAEKRKQGVAATNASEKQHQQPQSKKSKPNSAASQKKQQAPASISLSLVQSTITNSLNLHVVAYEDWCADMVKSLDSCVLQPLTVIDRIGVPSMICPPLGVGASQTADEQPIDGTTTAKYRSGHNSVSAVQSSGLQKGYAPYESVLGGADAVTSIPDDNIAVMDTCPVDLDKLTSPHLLSAIKEAPWRGGHVVRRYYEDMRRALSVYTTDSNAATLLIPIGDLARTLLPVWNKYKRQFPQKELTPTNMLYAALELGKTKRDTTSNLCGLSRKEMSHVSLLVKHTDHHLPIFNRDITLYSNPASKQKGTFRYFDAASSATSESSETSSEVKSGQSAGNHKGDKEYHKALQLFWKGLPLFNRAPTMNDLSTHINNRTNKKVGKVVLMLRNALEQHPESEKLWDLYLELYTRQKVSELDAVSAFSDATRFHPHSICIWKRYVVWCGWNAMNHVKESTVVVWLERLQMVAPMAVKCLASSQTRPRSEELSATISELVIYYWNCLWVVYSARAQPANSTSFVPSLLTHMRACLSAKSVQGLSDKMASFKPDMEAVELGEKELDCKWHVHKWALTGLVLPHHLLCISQVFLCTLVTRQFVSWHVIDRLFAALHSRVSCQTVYFIDIDNVDEPVKLKPFALAAVHSIYGGMLEALNGQTWGDMTAAYDKQLVDDSHALCLTSIDTTIAQLRRQQPHVLEKRSIKREELFWSFYRTTVGDKDIQSLSGMMADRRVLKFLLIVAALSTSEFPGNDQHAEVVITALWRHAILAAKSLGIDTSVFELSGMQPNGSNDISMAVVKRRAANARELYYQIIRYQGSAPPTSQQQLDEALMAADTSAEGPGASRDHIWDNAGVWTSIALVELLCFGGECGKQALDQEAIDVTLLWLRYGLKHLDAGNAGSRAQLWACILCLTMTQRSLETPDIVEVHDDLMLPPSSADSFQNIPPCFALVNFVLQAVLQANPSDQTLNAVGSYLVSHGRSNSELAVR